MTPPNQPQLYLVTPPEFELSSFPGELAKVLDQHEVACVRLALATRDEDRLSRAADALRTIALGKDAIVGAFCGTSKHDGMNAGEAGADYVAFGPVGTSVLGDGGQAPLDLFAWWSEMIEVPVVAEGHLDAEAIASLALVTDFLSIGEEIWGNDDPSAALGSLIAGMA